jgi:methyl-galactoside transport system substrate-binding protein
MKHAQSLALLLGAIAACTKTPPPAAPSAADAPKDASAPTAAAVPEEITIGAAIYKYEDTFMSGVRDAIAKAAAGKAKITFVDGANQQPVQNEKIDLFIAKKVNALAINPVDRTAASVLIDKAMAAKTPIVFFNREPMPEDMKKWDRVFYVGARAEESGTLAGEIVLDYWKKHPEADRNKDGVIQYVMLKGEPGHQDAELRTKFSIKAIEDAGIKTEKLAEDTGMWDRIKGQEKMAAFLGAHGDKIEVVLANNDDMALGAIEALKAAGYFKDQKFLPVVGVDATAPALKALEDGTLLGTVLNDALGQGRATFNLAYALGKNLAPSKETVGYELTDGKYVWIAYKKITKENVKDAL